MDISFNHTIIKFHLTNGIPKESLTWILIGGVLIRRFQNNQDINWWGVNWQNKGKMLIQLGGGENLRGH